MAEVTGILALMRSLVSESVGVIFTLPGVQIVDVFAAMSGRSQGRQLCENHR